MRGGALARFRPVRALTTAGMALLLAGSAVLSFGADEGVSATTPSSTTPTTTPATVCVYGTAIPPSTGTTACFPTSPTTTSATGPYYLALGDSVPVWNGSDSYPYQIGSHFASTIPNLTVVDMACSGETTGSMISDSLCAPRPSHSQIQEAVDFLNAHQGSVVLITIDIGGNDLLPCINGINVNIACIQQAEATMVTNLDAILGDLRQTAGPSVPIVGMNYYDPFLGDWLAGGAVQEEAALSVSLVTQLNSLLAGAYQAVGAPVADVASAFEITDLTDMVSSPWGTVSVAVDKACTLLDITCTVGQLEGFGDDPVIAGADLIAQTFEPVIASSLASTTTTTTTSTTTSSSTTTIPKTTTAPTTTTLATATAPASGSTSSGSLAFTGSGKGTWLTILAGVALLLFGFALLAIADTPRRIRLQLAGRGRGHQSQRRGLPLRQRGVSKDGVVW